MSVGEIAGLIAAGVFAVLVTFLAIPLIKLGKVLDETARAIRQLSDDVTPILEESAVTVQQANKQLSQLDAITSDIVEVTENVSSLVALFAATIGGPLIKISGFTAAVRAAIVGNKRAKGN